MLGAKGDDMERFRWGTRVHADLQRRFTPEEWADIWKRVLAELEG